MADSHDGGSLVLLFSHDASLLMTRRLMLEHEGCKVATSSSLPEFRACLLRHSFDLILLCQSISPEDCEAASQWRREHAPLTRLLLMFTRVDKWMPEHADVLLDARAGPKAFLETARRMLASNTARAS